jgi:hypothetical protein
MRKVAMKWYAARPSNIPYLAPGSAGIMILSGRACGYFVHLCDALRSKSESFASCGNSKSLGHT